MKNWIKSLKNLIVQQKSALPWDLRYIIQKPAKIVTSTLMKITHSLQKNYTALY